MPKVLVIDDDMDILEMVQTVLSNYNFNVNCANSATKLWESLGTHDPDVILMDIYLGDADGRQLCLKLKTTDRYRHIPVILYSAGNISPTSIQESLADDFIEKPFDIGLLAKKIRSFKN